MRILNIRAREILDSRGNPTIEVDLQTKRGWVTASVPSGASTGVHEALELRDGGQRYHGKGVLKAVANINGPIRKALVGASCLDQQGADEILLTVDGTLNKSRLGANAMLGASMAVCKAGALESDMPPYQYIASHFGRKATGKHVLPIPAFNVINGGAHAGTKLDFQEFMVWPVTYRSFSEALRAGSEIYHSIRSLLIKKFGKSAVNVGDEGGFAPPISQAREAIGLILSAAEECGHLKNIRIGLDCAASQFYDKTRYSLEGGYITTEKLTTVYEELCRDYPLVSIEDPFHEEAFDDYAVLRKQVPQKVQIVGDDLLCTNISRMCTAIEHASVNALLLKINQIGTISEALGAAQLARAEKWNVMVSHRSGETTDPFIADLSVGLSMGQLKSGAPCRGERLAKYNRLLRIEEELANRALYGGKNL